MLCPPHTSHVRLNVTHWPLHHHTKTCLFCPMSRQPNNDWALNSKRRVWTIEWHLNKKLFLHSVTSSWQRSVSCNVLSKWGPSSDCRARDESSTITDIWPLPPSASVHCPTCTLTTDNVYPELRPLIGHSPGHRGLSLAKDVLLVRSQHYPIPIAGNFTLFLKCKIQKRRKHLWVASNQVTQN